MRDVSTWLLSVGLLFVLSASAFAQALPRVRITAPTTEPTWQTATTPLAMTGTVSSPRRIVQVVWSTDRGYSDVATGLKQWNARVSLKPGRNLVTITAIDSWGYQGIATLDVTLADPRPPDLAPLLGWSFEGTGHTGWRMERCESTPACTMGAVALLPAEDSTWRDPATVAGQRYCYRVAATTGTVRVYSNLLCTEESRR